MLNKQKIIYHKKVEIIIAIFTVIGSYPLWGTWYNEELKEAKKYVNTSYTYVITDNKQGVKNYPIKDETSIDNLTPTTIYLRNDTRLRNDYRLAIKVPKNNELNYEYLKYSIDGKIGDLASSLTKDDNYYYYFVIDTGNLKEREDIHEMNIWIKEDTPLSECQKSFTYELVNIDNKVDM